MEHWIHIWLNKNMYRVCRCLLFSCTLWCLYCTTTFWKFVQLTQFFSVFPCLTLGWTDSTWGRSAGGRCRRALCRGQHAGSRTQDPGTGATQGTTEAEQARYPGHLWRCHPTTGNLWPYVILYYIIYIMVGIIIDILLHGVWLTLTYPLCFHFLFNSPHQEGYVIGSVCFCFSEGLRKKWLPTFLLNWI